MPESQTRPKPFPESGHTLIINGIGQRSVNQVALFLRALTASYTPNEVLGISLVGVHGSAVERLKQVPEMPQKGRFFRKPILTANDSEGAVKVFQDRSVELGDTARVAFHFIPYERGNGQLAQETLDFYQANLPDVFHLAIVTASADDPIDRTIYEAESETQPVSSLATLMILADQLRDMQRPYNEDWMLSAERAFLYSLAGFVASCRAFPLLNRHNYEEVIRSLTTRNRIIGVSLTQAHTSTGWPSYESQRAGFLRDAGIALEEIVTGKQKSMTSIPKREDANLEVTVFQFPAVPQRLGVFNRSLDQEFRDYLKTRTPDNVVHPLNLPANLAFLYSMIDYHRKESWSSVIAMHLYPVLKVPGLDLLRKLFDSLSQ